MYLDQITSAPPGARLIAGSTLAARHWETVLAAAALGRGDRAWVTPPLTTFPRWLAERWDSARRSGSAAHERCLLRAGQSTRLWQRIIEESADGAGIISPARVARWARQARQTLCDHGLPAGRPRPTQDPGDSVAFERWHRQFERTLDEAGWIDAESLLFRLNRLPVEPGAHDVLWLDPDPVETPERQRLAAIWRASGLGFAGVLPDTRGVQPALIVATDADDEIERACDWAARLIDAEPRCAVAVVVSDLAARSVEVERLFVDRLGADRVSNAKGRPLRETGVVGAALDALLLLSPRADFGTLSRWLRSPFFGSGDPDAGRRAAVLETRLRADVRAQHPFLFAWRSQGLRAELERVLPDAAARLDAALERLPRRASPSRWAEIWQAALRTLRWLGIEEGLAEPLAQAWDGTLSALAELTPITGSLDLPAALDELDRVVSEQEIRSPPRLRGVHLLARIGDVGPGFAGAWVTGLSDQSWPEPAPANPLVPWALQLELGMPAARPDRVLAAAAEELDRLGRRVPALVLSCPQRILDRPQVPHPRWSGWTAPERAAPKRVASEYAAPEDAAPEHAALKHPVPGTPSTSSYAARRIGARPRETLTDAAPPLAGRHIPGATRTLDLQSSCPLRAFVESRLGIRELEPALRGIDGRLRGNLLHRMLELLHRPRADAIGMSIDDCIAAAISELLPQGDERWQALVEAERRRARRLLDGWRDLESRRAPFTTIAVEQRTAVDIDGWNLGGRIDRIDRLGTGEELLLDYKTGKRPKSRWHDERLGDCQLPVYAQRAGTPVAAIVVAILNEDGASYRAIGPRADALPRANALVRTDALSRNGSGTRRGMGSGMVLDARDWQQQLDRWRAQLLTLIGEFAAGDTRIPGRGEDLEGTLWAALARTARMSL